MTLSSVALQQPIDLVAVDCERRLPPNLVHDKLGRSAEVLEKMSGYPRRRRPMVSLLVAALLLTTGAGAGIWHYQSKLKHSPLAGLRRQPVRRADLHVSLRAPGMIQSARNVEIECELENVSVNSEGRSFSARAASTIIELLPEGTEVEAGDVICRLDSSEFEELLRQQEIKLLEAKADAQKSTLDLKAAEIALQEYQLGVELQERQEIDAQMTLAKADMQRQADRIAWTKKMVGNGYMSEGQLIREEQLMLRSEISLDRLATQLKNFETYRVPMNRTRLEAAVERARMEVSFQEVRMRRREQQLERLRKQVDRCTIRAPHGGMLTYANDRSDPKVQLGAAVHQNMDLFLLPDLENMQVQTVLHETVLDRVEEGMPALVRVEALDKWEIEGKVISLSPLPIMDRNRRASEDVKSYAAKVQLFTVPPSLKPGMSAEVEIFTAHHAQALVVPSESVTLVDGEEVCYVANDDVLERRYVEVTTGTTDVVHVTKGLREGDEVVLNPGDIEPGTTIVDAAIEDEAPSVADSQEALGVVLETADSGGRNGGGARGVQLTP